MNRSALRRYLQNRYGRGQYRIKASGEIRFKHFLSNGRAVWLFGGWAEELDREVLQ
jgi:hypothetical protein